MIIGFRSPRLWAIFYAGPQRAGDRFIVGPVPIPAWDPGMGPARDYSTQFGIPPLLGPTAQPPLHTFHCTARPVDSTDGPNRQLQGLQRVCEKLSSEPDENN